MPKITKKNNNKLRNSEITKEVQLRNAEHEEKKNYVKTNKEKIDKNFYKQSCNQILNMIMETGRKEEQKIYFLPPPFDYIPKWKLKSFFNPEKLICDEPYDHDLKIFFNHVHKSSLHCSFCPNVHVKQICYIDFLNQFICRCEKHMSS